jgi:DNA repair exonuclease SbcCD ATPase subunit
MRHADSRIDARPLSTIANMVPAPTMRASHISEQSLLTAACELKYAQSSHLVDIISKDEDIRRLRFQIHILEDDNHELRGLLSQETDRSDAFERIVNENLARAEEAEAHAREKETDLQFREQEIHALQAEKDALQQSTEDVTAALTEKLALTRELSLLKPELEHLKAQASCTEALMTEKLSLQRELTNIQCELENAKREAKRALAKRRNTGVELAQEEQMDELRRQLAKEKRARQRAEEAAQSGEGDMQHDDIRKQLAKERKARQKAEEQLEAQDNSQVEDVRKDLLKEKKAKAKLEESVETLQAELEREKKAAQRATKKAEGNAQADDEAEELRTELAKEKKERLRVQKAAQQAADEFEAQKATLEEKLKQFRTKLKSTKDELKETQTELATSRETAPVKKASAKKAPIATKANAKKRDAAQMDPDATTLGTPGDGPAVKRTKKAAAGVGDKSTFSITPFLNKTTSVIADEDDEADSDAATSPVLQKAKQPLAQQPAAKVNIPPKKARQQKPKPALEMVTEENEPEDVHKQGQENATSKGQTLKIKTKTQDGPEDGVAAKKKPKLRKSLADFTSFNPDADVEKKKKRKLGGLGKTLFDEEAGDEGATAPAASRKGLFGTKGFGLLGGGRKGGVGSSFLGGSSKVGTTLLTATDGSGFMFSPLKKARRNLDDTLRG